MAMMLLDQLENPMMLAQFTAVVEQNSPRCHYCNTVLHENRHGKHNMLNYRCCDICYFEKIGEFIETNHVRSPYPIHR
jgi:hypothetical protein